jgi:hypothetical protein
MSVPAVVTQQGGTETGTASSFIGSLSANATLVISLEGQNVPLAVGWADVLTTSAVSGFAIFRYVDARGGVSEGTAPLQTQFPSRITVPYDNSSGFRTGVAVANLSETSVTLTATAWDQNGSQLGTRSFSERLPFTADRIGIVTFQNASGGIGGLGLRFNPAGTFTSVPIQ